MVWAVRMVIRTPEKEGLEKLCVSETADDSV